MTDKPEIWLRGQVEGINAWLQPVAHALLQAKDEVGSALKHFPQEYLWLRPAEAASIGFHLKHLKGILDRLFTYARGEMLTEPQMHYLMNEETPGQETVMDLITELNKQIDISLKVLETIIPDTLLEPRVVGRAKLPSTQLGLLFHAAEHTMRHVGQILVTARILREGNGTS